MEKGKVVTFRFDRKKDSYKLSKDILMVRKYMEWLIETKGGEVGGHSKNIDIQVENKFKAFKRYAEEYGLKWGFVRDIDEDLYINNSEYVDNMSDSRWKPLCEEL